MEELCATKKVRFIRMTQQKEDLPAEQRAPAIPKRRAFFVVQRASRIRQLFARNSC